MNFRYKIAVSRVQYTKINVSTSLNWYNSVYFYPSLLTLRGSSMLYRLALPVCQCHSRARSWGSRSIIQFIFYHLLRFISLFTKLLRRLHLSLFIIFLHVYRVRLRQVGFVRCTFYYYFTWFPVKWARISKPSSLSQQMFLNLSIVYYFVLSNTPVLLV